PVLALAWAVTVGGVLQLVYQLPYLKKIGMLVLPRINFRDTGAGGLTEQQAQELIDHFIMKIRMVRFLRTPEFDSLFSGDPIWATEV
ncbi:hypothetical protein MJN51_30870, partial [Salmonella enterica subsp. enterica serovar Kentucky]|nr:hypothetical protein [Salmonella enterica subsp. enterica serovar Kentucky]